MRKQTIKEKLKRSIASSRAPVFVRSDFKRLGGYDQVGRELKKLEDEGCLVRVGYGVYAKARKSSLSNATVPAAPLVEIGLSAMKKLGRKAEISRASKAYRDGKTTQMPMADTIAVKDGRVSRKIGFNGRFLRFER